MKEAPDYYIYLVSSLPMLRFGEKAPFSFKEFLGMCEGLISDEDIEVIKSAENISGLSGNLPPALRKWRLFDAALRNELAKIRASRKHIDPSPYLRSAGYPEPHIRNVAMNAYKNPSLLESEKILDQERWRFLEELSLGHYFDLDFLIVYALKLLIAEKWDRIQGADRRRALEEVVWERKG